MACVNFRDMHENSLSFFDMAFGCKVFRTFRNIDVENNKENDSK